MEYILRERRSALILFPLAPPRGLAWPAGGSVPRAVKAGFSSERPGKILPLTTAGPRPEGTASLCFPRGSGKAAAVFAGNSNPGLPGSAPDASGEESFSVLPTPPGQKA